MSLARFKTLVIAVLVSINVFFLAIIVIDNYAKASSERQTLENVCEILQSNGISIDQDNIKTNAAIRTMRTSRDTEAEAAAVSALLGQVEMSEQGAIFLYENNDRGTAKFSSAGDFEVYLNEGVILSEDSALKTVSELIHGMKLEAASMAVSANRDDETVTVLSAYKGMSIFNVTVNFEFIDGSLRAVIGRYLTGIEMVEAGPAISRISTALLGFLAAVKSGDIECDHIFGVEAGYQHSGVGPFGEGALVPSWLLWTDAGRYIIDDITGDILLRV